MDLSFILNQLGEEHADWKNAVSPPIYQTSNFCFPSVDDFRKAFVQELEEPLYTRGVNPTVSLLRKKLAALENTEDALVLSSGAAAISAAVLNTIGSGDHILCVKDPYSWAHYLMSDWVKRFRVEVDFVEGKDVNRFLSFVRPETKVIYLESPNSITFEQQDLKTIAAFAGERGITTICDNSYSTPLFQRPHELGIDLVLHSATKYLNGHSDVVAGVICGSRERIRRIQQSEFMTLGAILSPLEAWLILRGMRTLELRVQRSSENAFFLVQELKHHPLIAKLYYPGEWEVNNTEERNMGGGMFTIDLNLKSIQQVEHFCNSLKRFKMAVSWGGYESLQLPLCAIPDPEGKRIDWNRVRLYCGIEKKEVLLEDLMNALSSVK